MTQEVSVTRAAELMGVSRRTVERRIRAGQLAVGYQASGRRLVTVPNELVAATSDALAVPGTDNRAMVADLSRQLVVLTAELAVVRDERDWLRQSLLDHIQAMGRLAQLRPAPAPRPSAWSRVQQWWASMTSSRSTKAA